MHTDSHIDPDCSSKSTRARRRNRQWGQRVQRVLFPNDVKTRFYMLMGAAAVVIASVLVGLLLAR